MATKHKLEPEAGSANGRLKECAARAQETDRLANEADAESTRLRKDFKRARKSYKAARQAAKTAAKEAKKARAELSECLKEAFRDLAVALQKEEKTQTKSPAGEPKAITKLPTSRSAEADSRTSAESQLPAAAAG